MLHCPVCNEELNVNEFGFFECEVCGLREHEANLWSYEGLKEGEEE